MLNWIRNPKAPSSLWDGLVFDGPKIRTLNGEATQGVTLNGEATQTVTVTATATAKTYRNAVEPI